MKKIAVIALGLSLAACATTTSFAPPDIRVRQEMTDTDVARDCAPNLPESPAVINPNVQGAQLLTGNFIIGYRCAMRAAADGRQPWQILSFVSLVGSSLAAALGAGPDVAIVGGAANALFTAGNSYYAPQQQAEILSDALDAFLCIQTESVGISAFTISRVSETERNLGRFAADDSGRSVEVTVEMQYFNMVSAALMSVERAAAQRLRSRGTPFDAAGVIAEIERLAQRAAEARTARNAGPPAAPASLTNAERAAFTDAQTVQLDLNLLRPKLDQCVTRAKI